ncbi:hypothetical protein ACA910_013391 [Epithemia clementina (nom. ined.)]
MECSDWSDLSHRPIHVIPWCAKQDEDTPNNVSFELGIRAIRQRRKVKLGTIIHQRKWNAKLWYNTGKRTFMKWWDLMDPSPPEQCPCGNVTEDHCRYYQEVEGSFYCRPVRHWALVGEIEENLTDPIRPQVVFKSKFGERFMVNFHFDNRWEPPTFFNWNQMTNGSTMCILYALQKTFMDLNKGVRVEDQGACMVFPTSLPILSDECENCWSKVKNEVKIRRQKSRG